MDNHALSRAFSLYAELLQLHGQDERLADWLSGAAIAQICGAVC